MKRILIVLLAVMFSGCGLAPVLIAPYTPPPAVQPAEPPVPVPSAPVVLPDPHPPAPLVVNDSSELTVTLKNGTLLIALSPGVQGAWVRLLVDGAVTKGTGDYVGLSALMPAIVFNFRTGLEVQTSPTTSGPWTTVAFTQ